MVRRLSSLLAIVALLAVLAWTGARLHAPARLSVLVLTVESLRADALDAETAPELTALARARGVTFANHRAVSAWTGTNVITLLTGWSPFQHGVRSRGRRLPAGHDLALELVADAGWRVSGLQAFMRIPIFDQLGLSREDADGDGDQPGRWLAARAADGEPFFLWYHYLHTHLPYRPADAFDVDWRALVPAPDEDAVAERFERLRTRGRIEAGTVAFRADERPAIAALYRAGVAEFDAWFARLWARLETSGLAARTVVIVTADHGEELLERGQVGHASTSLEGHLHEEIVRVPLIVFLPPGTAGPHGTVVEAPSDHRDVMTTVLAVLGVAPPPGLEGADLRALPAARPWTAATSRAGYSEPEPERPSAMLFARAEGRWKLHRIEPADGIAFSRLYDLDADPGETVDLAAAEPEVVARLEAATAGERAEAPPPPRAGTHEPPGPRPRLLRPAASGAYAYDDIGGRFVLEWTGVAERDYVIEYSFRHGEGWLDGTIDVRGTAKDFGAIDRRYWDTWVVPNGPYRLRVGHAGDEPRWSEWLELSAE
jgi:arylsulfatase A-like enzyme